MDVHKTKILGLIEKLKDAKQAYVFDKKTFIYIVAGAAFVFLIFVYLAANGLIKKGSSYREFNRLSERLNGLVDYGKNVPTHNTLVDLQRDKELLGKNFQELEKTLGKMKKVKVKTPMDFKGELLKTQRSLTALSKERNISIPENIGFDEFTGKEIPKERDIPALGRELEKIRVLMIILMNNGVFSVSSVSKQGVVPVKLDPNDSGYFYIEHKFEVEFEVSQDALMNVLSSLIASNEFYVIKTLEVKYIADSRYAVKMVISGIEFL